MRFGVHLSISGRLAGAAERGRAIGCRSLQIFCGNPRGWTKKPLDPVQVEAFRKAIREAGIAPLIVHATYLINLAAPDERIFTLSRNAFLDELRRSSELGATAYVVHCGSHKGEGEEAGRRRIIEALRGADQALPERPEILLENTAGTRNSLGTTFEDLAALVDGAGVERLGVCFDTCHALAAGYELRTPEGARQTLDTFDRVLGLKRLRCLHVNDSKGDLASRMDRHTHIGEGCIGRAGFQAFFADRRLWGLPAILETPQRQPDDDQMNLWRAVELAGESGAVGKEYLEAMPTAAFPPVRGASKRSRKKKKSAKKKPAAAKKKKTGKKKRSKAAKASRAKPAKAVKKKRIRKAKKTAKKKRGAGKKRQGKRAS